MPPKYKDNDTPDKEPTPTLFASDRHNALNDETPFLFSFLNINHYRNRKVDRRVTKIKYEDAKLVGNFFGNNAKKEAMPKEIFEEGTIGTFEGVEVVLPKDYDKYLTLLFSNYMKYPPIEQQVGHHHNKGLSLTEDYITYSKKHGL